MFGLNHLFLVILDSTQIVNLIDDICGVWCLIYCYYKPASDLFDRFFNSSRCQCFKVLVLVNYLADAEAVDNPYT